MNGYDRILATLEGRPPDSLPLMPITMMFAADQLGVPYGRYAADHRVLVERSCWWLGGSTWTTFPAFPIRPARRPIAAPRSAISTTSRRPSTRPTPCCTTKALARLKVPDPLGGGRMHDRVQAAALFRQRVAARSSSKAGSKAPAPKAPTCGESTR